MTPPPSKPPIWGRILLLVLSLVLLLLTQGEVVRFVYQGY